MEARTKNICVKSYRKFDSPEITKIASICSMYQTTLNTLEQVKIEILSGMLLTASN